MIRRTSAALAALLLVAGCQTGGAAPGASSTPSSSSSSASPATALTRTGVARRAVTALQKAAAGLPVLKVDLTSTTATLSALRNGQVVAWQWRGGVVTPVESDIQYIQQARFDPAAFHFDDLAGIFAQAARISGSSSNQELQIVEYDQGRVLMTVTTRPESMPVFFRADGSAINQLAFPSTAAFSEAIRDTVGSNKRVLAMGWDEQTGFWTDTADKTAGVVDRMTRQAKVPAWSASRKADSTGPTFQPSVVDPAVLSRLVASLPAKVGSPGAKVSFQVQRIDQMATPVITFDVGGQKVVTTLSGTDITSVVGG